MEVAPYPFASWPRLGREALRAQRAWAQALAVGGDRAFARATALLGIEPRVRPDAPRLVDLETALSELPATGCLLQLVHEGATAPVAAVLALTTDAAADLVDRTLGGEGDAGHPPTEPLDDLSEGVLAYLAARLLAASAGPLRLDAVAAAPADARQRLGDGRVLSWSANLMLGPRSHVLRLLVPARPLPHVSDSAATSTTRPAPAWLGELELTLCAHAARVILKRSQLASLSPGDAILPDDCALRPEGHGLAGRVHAHLQGARRTTLVCGAERDGLRIQSIRMERTQSMSEGKRIETRSEGTDPVELAGDAPVEVCLELARFTLPLQELARLAVGDVLQAGCAVGAPITLRAGGKALARGELVVVDDEVGVRVTELLDGQPAD